MVNLDSDCCEHCLVKVVRGSDTEVGFQAGVNACAGIGDDYRVTDVSVLGGLAGKGYFKAEIGINVFLDDFESRYCFFHDIFLSARIRPLAQTFNLVIDYDRAVGIPDDEKFERGDDADCISECCELNDDAVSVVELHFCFLLFIRGR